MTATPPPNPLPEGEWLASVEWLKKRPVGVLEWSFLGHPVWHETDEQQFWGFVQIVVVREAKPATERIDARLAAGKYLPDGRQITEVSSIVNGAVRLWNADLAIRGAVAEDGTVEVLA